MKITEKQIPDEAADVLAKIGFCSSYAAKSALVAALNAWEGMEEFARSHGRGQALILPLPKEGE